MFVCFCGQDGVRPWAVTAAGSGEGATTSIPRGPFGISKLLWLSQGDTSQCHLRVSKPGLADTLWLPKQHPPPSPLGPRRAPRLCLPERAPRPHAPPPPLSSPSPAFRPKGNHVNPQLHSPAGSLSQALPMFPVRGVLGGTGGSDIAFDAHGRQRCGST